MSGVNFVKRIAQRSQVDVEIVTECLRQLLFYNLIALIDIFQLYGWIRYL